METEKSMSIFFKFWDPYALEVKEKDQWIVKK